MKYLNLFLLFLLLGIGIVVGNTVWKRQKPVVTAKIFPAEKRFSIDPPPTQARTGNITAMNGEVMWQSRVATESSQIINPQKLQQAELLGTGKDGSASATFANVVDFQMMADSEVEFLQTLPQGFVYRQNKGVIVYEKTGDTALSIRTLGLLISVLRGKISVETDMETHFAKLKIIEGTAKIAYNNIDYETQTLDLEKGQTLVFDSDKREVDIKKSE